MAVWTLAIGFLLLGLLFVVGIKGLLTARDLEQESCAFPHDRLPGEPDAMELAERIFSPVDWTLIQGLNNGALTELFRRERKAVALLWVRDTSQNVHQVMQQHAEAARASRNLNVRSELKLIAQYGELRLICGLLYASIQLGGPLWLRRVAIHAQELSRKIADAQAGFQATASARYSAQA